MTSKFVSFFINTRVGQKFCNILVCASLQHVYHDCSSPSHGKHLLWLVVGVLMHYTLVHSVCDLKAAQMNVHYSLI